MGDVTADTGAEGTIRDLSTGVDHAYQRVGLAGESLRHWTLLPKKPAEQSADFAWMSVRERAVSNDTRILVLDAGTVPPVLFGTREAAPSTPRGTST